jgi:hypothetical protein
MAAALASGASSYSITRVRPSQLSNTLSTGQRTDSVVGGADALNGAGKPREQAKEDEIEVYRDIILHIPREQAKEDEIEV